MFLRFAAVSAACVLVSGSLTHAAFTAPSWVRPVDSATASASKTTYQAWETFTNALPSIPPMYAIKDTVPDVTINPNGTGELEEPTGTAFIIGADRIYSFAAPLSVNVSIPSYGVVSGANTHFFVQLRRLDGSTPIVGFDEESQPILTSFKIDGVAITSLPDFSYTSDSLEDRFTFTLPSTASSHVFSFTSSGSSTSLDAVAVDTLVPEPASLTVVGLAAMGLLARRRRD